MPVQTRLQIKCGVTYSKLLVHKGPDGLPASLAGMSALAQFRARPGSPIILTASTEDGSIKLEQTEVDDSTVGVIEFAIPGPATRTLKAQKLLFDIVLTTTADTDGEPSLCPFEGVAEFLPAITIEA